jgi:hypothetical protein
MGCWDAYCFICGNACNNVGIYDVIISNLNKGLTPKQEKEIKYIITQSEWLNKCIFLCENGNVIPNVTEIDCNITFSNKKNTYLMENDRLHYDNIGIFMHMYCYKYLQKKYNIKFTFKNFPIFINELNIFDKINSVNIGIINNYQHQHMDYYQMYIDNNIFMILSPLKNIKNSLRINKILSQYKLDKSYINRISPPISATFYKNNDIKYGNNNMFWIKKNNKWIQINDNIIEIQKEFNFNTDNKIINNLSKIPQIEYFNTKPIFIKDYKIDKKKLIIKFIGTLKEINLINKYINKK